MAEVAEFTCPKCESPMRSYERNGIVVDQCTGCKGIFLDRGELEQLMAAEEAHYEGGGGGEKGIVGKMRDRAEEKLREQQQRQQGQGRERGEKGEGGFLGGMFSGGD